MHLVVYPLVVVAFICMLVLLAIYATIYYLLIWPIEKLTKRKLAGLPVTEDIYIPMVDNEDEYLH